MYLWQINNGEKFHFSGRPIMYKMIRSSQRSQCMYRSSDGRTFFADPSKRASRSVARKQPVHISGSVDRLDALARERANERYFSKSRSSNDVGYDHAREAWEENRLNFMGASGEDLGPYRG